MHAAVAQFEDDADEGFDGGGSESQDLRGGDEKTEEFQNCGGTAEAGGEKVAGKEEAVFVPHRNRSGADAAS